MAIQGRPFLALLCWHHFSPKVASAQCQKPSKGIFAIYDFSRLLKTYRIYTEEDQRVFLPSLEPNCLRHFLFVSTVLLWLNHAANSLHVVYLFVSPLPQTCSGHLVVFSGRLNLLTSASNKKKLLGIHRQFEQSCQHAGCWQTPYWTYYSQHSFPWLNSKKTHFPGESNPPSLSALI